MKKEQMEVNVDGNTEQRFIDYSVYRGKDEDGHAKFLDYPVLEPKEHIYEDEHGIKIFTSSVS